LTEFDGYRGAAIEIEAMCRAAAVDGDLQQVGAADEGEKFARSNVGVGAAEAVEVAVGGEMDAQVVFPTGEIGRRYTGHQVAEAVDVEDLAFDALAVSLWGQLSELHRIGHRGTDCRQGEAASEMGGDWREEIAAVEGGAAAYIGQSGCIDGAHLGVGCVEGEAEETVVRAYPVLIPTAGGQRAATAADAGIDDGQVDGIGGEFAGGVAQNKSAGENVLGRDFMGQVDQMGFRGDGEDDPFHGAHVVVPHAEVGGQGDDAHGVTISGGRLS
jgi:hypothetical protein